MNNAFYRLPERTVFEGWAQRTPPGFVVAVKGSRYLTHVKRLKEPEEPVGRLLERSAGLGDRRGPILLQLPPTLQASPELVWADRGEKALNPLWTTTGWGYLRLHHGARGWAYSARALKDWATRLHDAFAEGYAYANNDPGGAAPRDAKRLRELLG